VAVCRDRLTNFARPVGLDHTHRGVVHEHDHRRRAAGAGEALDDLRGGGQIATLPADIACAQQAEDADAPERFDIAPWELAPGVDLAGVGGDDLGDHPLQGIGCYGWGNASRHGSSR
jgi:hypothetical protein